MRQIRARSRVTRPNCTTRTDRGRRRPSGLNTPRPASLPYHTRLRPPPALRTKPQSSTAPVWWNARTHTHRGLTGRVRWRECQLIQVRVCFLIKMDYSKKNAFLSCCFSLFINILIIYMLKNMNSPLIVNNYVCLGHMGVNLCFFQLIKVTFLIILLR